MYNKAVVHAHTAFYDIGNFVPYIIKTPGGYTKENFRKGTGEQMKAFLILEDGHVFSGRSIGAAKEAVSEIVFNTSMTGYLEVLTDPSYAGQAVAMTYPLIGNYGICREDMESERPWVSGFIVRELSRMPSNFRSENSIQDFLTKYQIHDSPEFMQTTRNSACTSAGAV